MIKLTEASEGVVLPEERPLEGRTIRLAPSGTFPYDLHLKQFKLSYYIVFQSTFV